MKNYSAILVMLLFLMAACKEDPCQDITCVNDGYCEDGACVCPEGYNGTNCGNQITPAEIRLSEIRVIDWPAMRENGLPWDSDSGPDLSFELRDEADNVILTSDTTFFDVQEGADIANPYLPFFRFDEIGAQRYQFRLYDEDAGGFREFMEGIEFSLYSSFNGFPDPLTIDGGGDLKVELYLSYHFD